MSLLKWFGSNEPAKVPEALLVDPNRKLQIAKIRSRLYYLKQIKLPGIVERMQMKILQEQLQNLESGLDSSIDYSMFLSGPISDSTISEAKHAEVPEASPSFAAALSLRGRRNQKAASAWRRGIAGVLQENKEWAVIKEMQRPSSEEKKPLIDERRQIQSKMYILRQRKTLTKAETEEKARLSARLVEIEETLKRLSNSSSESLSEYGSASNSAPSSTVSSPKASAQQSPLTPLL
mmetsp:Transcript_1370/g.2595  ORF Transcript_1370/g.2595 Transcript_1370/m.2595 type:complete len:235 (-) Transcript_1370:356-1060(-)